jgi:hypothetical protein
VVQTKHNNNAKRQSLDIMRISVFTEKAGAFLTPAVQVTNYFIC